MLQAGFGAFAGLLILVVLFCSIASSIDSLLAATSDLVLNDMTKNVLGKEIKERNFHRMAGIVTIAVGLIVWLLSLPRWPIVEVLYLSGPLVASLIWPIIAGLYWQKINRPLVLGGIVTACLLGVWAYESPALGWFTASLIGAAVSMVFTISARWIAPKPIDRSV